MCVEISVKKKVKICGKISKKRWENSENVEKSVEKAVEKLVKSGDAKNQ